jgi:GAF domain
VDYRFDAVNALFEQMTGLVDPVGRTARELVPELETHWIDAYARVALLGETLRFEQGSDVMGRWFDVFATPVGTAGRFAIVFKDQTARRATDRVLQESARVNAFRAQLLDSLREATDSETSQRRSAELLGELLGAERVHYAEFDAAVDHGVVRADYCRAGVTSVVGIYRLDEYGPDVVNSLRSGRMVRVDDVTTDERLDVGQRSATVAMGIGAYVMVPVVRRGRPVAGLISLMRSRNGPGPRLSHRAPLPSYVASMSGPSSLHNFSPTSNSTALLKNKRSVSAQR